MLSQSFVEASVSRETLDRLRDFAAFVRRVGRRINLIAPGDADHIWERHVLDSLQVLAHAPPGWQRWADLGSGGGFPGMVVSIAAGGEEGRKVYLIESDGRKAEFLREAAARYSRSAEVLAGRIERVAPLGVDIVSARALAPLPLLLGYVSRHLRPEGTALLLKGKGLPEELAEAGRAWRFSADSIPSMSDGEARIARIRSLERI